ncbi:MAG: hypothetical protein WDM92_05180 [Caulobacteraceae bacterium]
MLVSAGNAALGASPKVAPLSSNVATVTNGAGQTLVQTGQQAKTKGVLVRPFAPWTTPPAARPPASP